MYVKYIYKGQIIETGIFMVSWLNWQNEEKLNKKKLFSIANSH